MASRWRPWRRTYAARTVGRGACIGTSYPALDLARATERVLPCFEVTAEWRVGRR